MGCSPAPCLVCHPGSGPPLPLGKLLLVRELGVVMAISQELLEILVCPADKEALELKPDGSGLKCTKCHRVYPIKDDIPIMLIDEATIEE